MKSDEDKLYNIHKVYLRKYFKLFMFCDVERGRIWRDGVLEMTIRDEQTGAGILTCPSSHTYLFQFTFLFS